MHLRLAVTLSGIISLLSPCLPTLAAPYTNATVAGVAFDIFTYSASDPQHAASGTLGDNLLSTAIGYGSGGTDASFGTNSAYVNNSQVRNISVFGDITLTWNMAASYSLQVLPQSGYQGTTIFDTTTSTNLSGNSVMSLNNTLIGNFEFVYGVPYEIVSVLTLSGSQNTSDYAGGTGTSTWDDVFIFQGGAVGTKGVAQFNVNLTGALQTQKYSFLGFCGEFFYPGPCAENDASLRLTALLGTINIPGNSWIEVASGTPYLVHVPEPSSLLFLACGLGAFALYRCRWVAM